MMKNNSWVILIHRWLLMASFLLTTTTMAQNCGNQAGGTLCPQNLCCSEFGWCGSGSSWCGAGCQSGPCWNTPTPTPPTPTPPTPTPSPPPPSTPSPPSPSGGVGSIISASLFEQILKHRNNEACPAKYFYTYDAFITAANSFSGFGTTGEVNTRKREIAAFLAQTSHETTGGWADAPDGPYSWGYCFKEEKDATEVYCEVRPEWPCVPGKKYYGRGPIQISYNYNYGPAGTAIGVNLLNNPDLVATDATISFKTALWFWMTPQPPKPSSHDVIIGKWIPSSADISAGRLPGYGVITNIINGGLECGNGPDPRVADRIGFYKRYCDMLGVTYGDNLDCGDQRPFGQ